MAKLSDELKDQQYCLFTTFKKDGRPVATPMWFVLQEEWVYMTTRGQSWKVKRLRRNPTVEISWSNSSGSKHGKPIKARAVVVQDELEAAQAVRQLNQKYGLRKKLIDFGLRFAKDQSEAIVKVGVEPGPE